MNASANLAETSRAAASFRDPSGRLLSVPGRILRIVYSSGVKDLEAFLSSRTAQRMLSSGRLVQSRVLRSSELQPELRDLLGIQNQEWDHSLVLEHETIPFPSFPYEWAPEMLHEAAALTLRLAQELAQEEFGLKDATPYNILFRGPDPVFVDLLSFERRKPGNPTWLPYAQFVRTFLLPLLVQRSFGLRLDQILTTRRDGLEPESVYPSLTFLQKFRPPFLNLVSIPTWLSRRSRGEHARLYEPQCLANHEKAHFILLSLFGRLARLLKRLGPRSSRSQWIAYEKENSYSNDQFDAKRSFVARAMRKFSPKHVLDVGCNTGYFSKLAASSGASVVAIDQDPIVVGRLWRKARSSGLDILPLVVDLTRPTPATGWRNRESPSFLDRARGGFDMVFMLAVIHHMLVSERIPLEEILELAWELSRHLVVLEWVTTEDPMFRLLCRGREDLYRHFTLERFEAACRIRFDILCEEHVQGHTRKMYLLRKKG